MAKIIEHGGKKYIIVGDKAIPYNFKDKLGNPVVKVKCEEIKNRNGGTDVKIHVSTLKVIGNNKLLNKDQLINEPINKLIK